MTEAEWMASTDPRQMLRHLAGDASVRKLRLFACACCRRIWHLLSEERARAAVELAERHADGDVGRRALLEAWDAEGVTPAGHAVDGATALGAGHGADWASRNAAGALREELSAAFLRSMGRGKARPGPAGFYAQKQKEDACYQAERAAQSALLRDIFGSPFHPVAIDSRWLNATVTELARIIYEGRAFDRLPILADALMNAGCESAEILEHCRSDGPHVRGCWVVDLILGMK